MTSEEILKLFRSTGALLEGHFVLSSGRHSPTYFQCAKVLQYPKHLTQLGHMITEQFRALEIDIVISPAVGGIVIGTEVGRQLGVNTIFAERQNGIMTLRRGFEIEPGQQVLIVEDVITTGRSVREVMGLVKKHAGNIVGVGVVVDRSNGSVKLHSNQYATIKQQAVSYAADEIPAALARLPMHKPGSQGLL